MTIITLTTDFGLSDGYVGVMKGVILGIAPGARLVDLCHEIAPHDVRQGAYILASAIPYFPNDTVHVAVVDPGVGSVRRPLLVTTSRAAFVGPDNGLFTFALDEPGAQAWTLVRSNFWLPDVSHTFHGRDIFAPVAAHLATGVPPHVLGNPITDAVRLAPLMAERIGNNRIRGHVIHVDRFGNLITNIPATWIAIGAWTCDIASRRISRISDTYAVGACGELLTLVGSHGTLEVAIREGSAAQTLGASVGLSVEFTQE